MIDKIISFITYFPANLRFFIGEYEFNGLCLKPRVDFPWEGRKERNRFLNNLADEENGGDLDRFVYWTEEWNLEIIHQRFTWMYFSGILGYLWLFAGLICFLGGAWHAVWVTVAFGLIWLLSEVLFRKSVSRVYTRIQLLRMAVEMLKEAR